MIVSRTWEALPVPLRAALGAGRTVVTPNNRLARRLAAMYDAVQRETGHAAWTSPAVVPWNAWLDRLWLDVLAVDAKGEERPVLRPAQSRYLWRGIVAAAGLPLLDGTGAATLAADAWSTVHAWGEGGPSWRAWAGSGDDCALFAGWADDYAMRLAASGTSDAALLPDALARRAPDVPAWRGTGATIAGFVEMSPAQERLLDALRSAGMSIDRCATLREGPGRVSRATGATAHDELAAALLWARDHAISDPGAAIAIAIEDFASRREEVRALAEEILCPALQWPGNEDAARPYDLSLGLPASDVPLVAAAIGVVRLANGPVATEEAAALVRSPYLAGDWIRRAALEPGWRSDGRRDVTIDDAIAGLDRIDREVADRWRAARRDQRWPPSATPREWVDLWRSWLVALGWPGERMLSSAEWQARDAWEDILAQFATLGAVSRRLAAGDAVATLCDLAGERVFQPEAGAAAVGIMGVLEAAGLPVDALWVAGLAGDVWPPAPRPNPLLPLPWQKERNVPRATPARELAYASALTSHWVRGAADVVFSCAASPEEPGRTLCALVPAAPEILVGTSLPASTAAAQRAGAPARESVTDDRAPPLAIGSAVRGGAALIEAQSDCPFRAWARYRLDAEAWPETVFGLSARERGMLVHAALATFWRAVGDSAMLAALAPAQLAAHVDAAAEAAVHSGAMAAARWRAVPPLVRAGEAMRVASIVRAWLDGVERGRPPFRVAEIEATRELVLGGVAITLRVDRIDALDGGGLAIIDYKTGRAKSPAKWFGIRPEAPQIGLYALAQRALAPVPSVRAAAYAQLKPGDVKLQGIAADPAAWPGLVDPQRLPGGGLPGWTAIEAQWERSLVDLAIEVREGIATVAPRDIASTCAHCGLQPLCRIGALPPGETGGNTDD